MLTNHTHPNNHPFSLYFLKLEVIESEHSADSWALTHYLPVFSYDDRGSKFEFYIKKGSMKKDDY